MGPELTTSHAAGVAQATPAGVALTVERLRFEDVYLERYPAMVRVAVLLLGDQAQAEEVVQDAFVAAYRRWSRIESPGAYIRQSVTNGCRDVLRRRRIAESLRVRRSAADPAQPHEHVDDLLAALPPKQRLAVVLRFYDDQSIDQIAELLDTRPGTVKSLLHRAMALLREELEP
jgi:RNA polymerase sigma-70 factor (sigma-E family)